MNTDIFLNEFFNILHDYPKSPSNFVKIEKKQLKNYHTIGDMRVYVDTSFQQKLRKANYLYIIKDSTSEAIILLDLKHSFTDYANCIEEIGYSYDFDRNQIVPVSVNTVNK